MDQDALPPEYQRILAIVRDLKAWRVLTKLRTDPGRATALLRALLVLTNFEANR